LTYLYNLKGREIINAKTEIEGQEVILDNTGEKRPEVVNMSHVFYITFNCKSGLDIFKVTRTVGVWLESAEESALIQKLGIWESDTHTRALLKFKFYLEEKMKSKLTHKLISFNAYISNWGMKQNHQVCWKFSDCNC